MPGLGSGARLRGLGSCYSQAIRSVPGVQAVPLPGGAARSRSVYTVARHCGLEGLGSITGWAHRLEGMRRGRKSRASPTGYSSEVSGQEVRHFFLAGEASKPLAPRPQSCTLWDSRSTYNLAISSISTVTGLQGAFEGKLRVGWTLGDAL